MQRNLAHVRRLLPVLVAVGLMSGCFAARSPVPRTLEDRLRDSAEGLPDDALELVRFTNAQFRQPPNDQRLEKALAAAERAVSLRPGYQTRWRAARAASFVAQWHSKPHVRLAAARRGLEHGRVASTEAPKRVGGPYYSALCLALLARLDPEGALARLQEVVRLGEEAREIDDAFQRGGPLRLLGGVYASAPPWPTSVGDIEEAKELFEELVARFPDYPVNHFLFGETLLKLSDYGGAAAAFSRVLKSRARGIWRLEGSHFRALARQRLADIQRLYGGH